MALFTVKLPSLFFRSSTIPRLEDLESGFGPNCEFCDVTKERGFNIVLKVRQ